MSKLFSSLKIRNVELKNRIAVSPMCQYSSNNGMPNDWHFVHLGSVSCLLCCLTLILADTDTV